MGTTAAPAATNSPAVRIGSANHCGFRVPPDDGPCHADVFCTGFCLPEWCCWAICSSNRPCSDAAPYVKRVWPEASIQRAAGTLIGPGTPLLVAHWSATSVSDRLQLAKAINQSDLLLCSRYLRTMTAWVINNITTLVRMADTRSSMATLTIILVFSPRAAKTDPAVRGQRI